MRDSEKITLSIALGSKGKKKKIKGNKIFQRSSVAAMCNFS